MDITSAILLKAQRERAAAAPVWEAAIAQGGKDADGRVRINSAGITEDALCATGVETATGDVVAIVRATAPLVVAVLVPASTVPTRWASGIAQGAKDADGRVAVTLDGATVMAVCPVGITPAQDDVLAVLRDQTPLVTGILTQANTPPDEGEGGGDQPAPPDEGPTSGVTTFPALYTRTWQQLTIGQGGGYTVSDTIGFSLLGPPTLNPFWFYQASITATLAGATVDSARMRIPRRSVPFGTLRLVFNNRYATWPTPMALPAQDGRLMPDKVTGAPADATVSLSGTAAQWVTIPTAAAQAMVDTQIAISGYPTDPDAVAYSDGVSVDPESGLIEIRWHR